MNYSDEDLRNGVRAKYAAIASEVKDRSTNEGNKTRASCCQPSSCGASENPITSGLYSDDELADVPDDAALASLGCGNPTALAALQPGDVVLDLGSGGGIDVILSARRVAPGGKAYGLDMTDEMLDIARQNQKQAGITNAEFLKGHIEDIPLADGAVDVVISNCVINLSTDKRKTLSEALRVLKPGGRFAVSDIVSTGPVPESVRRDAELWAGCLAGSLEEGEYRRLLQEVGFEEIDIKPTRIYDAANFCGGDANADTKESGKTNSITGLFMGAFVEARKPNR
ncbi:MAG: arsenite methyltransferase [Candidatus Krumholzibacteria bacterium]|nr:arsenite methyltransferase [Candidatus Krumholzibacteria bacterium]